MAIEKVKRSEIRTFMDVDPGYQDWALIGEGVPTAAIEMNPEIETETYIHQDNATSELQRYAPSLGIEAIAVKGDDVFGFVDDLRINRAVLSGAHTQIVNVWMYKDPVEGAYPAELQDVTVAVESAGGDGGVASRISYTIYYRGDPVKGKFNLETLTFTADA